MIADLDRWPLDDAEISMATYMFMVGYAKTVLDVRRKTDAELLAIPMIGRKRLAELRRVCGSHLAIADTSDRRRNPGTPY